MLIEMLAVLAIIGICAAMLWPLVPSQGRWKLETAARGLAGDLRLARQAAITTGDPCKVEFHIYKQKYQLRMLEKKKPERIPEEKQTIYLPEGIYFEGSTTFEGGGEQSPYLHFNRFGHPSSGGTVILKSEEGDKLYVIVLPVTGRVRISPEPPENWQ